MARSRKSLVGLGYVLSAAALGVVVPTATRAVTIGLTANPDAADNSSFNNLIQQVINIVLFVAGAAAALFMAYSGFQYVTAGGDDDKAATARKGLVNSVIGLVIVAGIYLIFGATRNLANQLGSGNEVKSSGTGVNTPTGNL